MFRTGRPVSDDPAEDVQAEAPKPTADDLEGALLIAVVHPGQEWNTAQIWTSDDVPRGHHAVMLRAMADQLEPSQEVSADD